MGHSWLTRPSALDHLQATIFLIFSLRDHSSELPKHDLVTAFSSTVLLSRYFDELSNIVVLRFASKQPIRPTSDCIAGIPFEKFVRHFRDLARDMSTIMKPAQCYLVEMEQMKTLAAAIFAAGESVFEARSPALIDAFSSGNMLTYCASLARDPRADLVHTLSEEEMLLPIDLASWGDVVLPRCGMLINGAHKNGDDRLAKEYVDSRFLFLLETWSVKAPEPEGGALNISLLIWGFYT